jgi:hypothetical protein
MRHASPCTYITRIRRVSWTTNAIGCMPGHVQQQASLPYHKHYLTSKAVSIKIFTLDQISYSGHVKQR